jgi:stress-induced morphogen
MRESVSKETHFHVTITTSAFQSKPQPARHRMVYALLKEEISREGGIHALQLRTRTPDEEQKQMQTQTQIQTQNGQELSQ